MFEFSDPSQQAESASRSLLNRHDESLAVPIPAVNPSERVNHFDLFNSPSERIVHNGEDLPPKDAKDDVPMTVAEELQNTWYERLKQDLPNPALHAGITQWLMGEDPDRLATLSRDQLAINHQAMDYRYRILKERYLGMSQERAYRNLMQRLSSVFVLRSKIATWISLSRDRQRSVVEVLQEIIQEMLQNDRYMQQQIAWIAEASHDLRLRNALVLASLEEYCLRPIRNQPLLACRFINYLRRSQRGGMTNVPNAEFIRLVSEEIAPDDNEGSISLLDNHAVADYQEAQDLAEQLELRQAVVRKLAAYLEEKVEPMAATWLHLYLEGKSQEAIALSLDIPIQKVYRLREKVSYHALKVFAIKRQSDLVNEWLNRPEEEIA
jgi:DNA-directed RNA polymerase specialized sigma24 family protein